MLGVCACVDADSFLLCSHFDMKVYLNFMSNIVIYVLLQIVVACLQGSAAQFCVYIYIYRVIEKDGRDLKPL